MKDFIEMILERNEMSQSPYFVWRAAGGLNVREERSGDPEIIYSMCTKIPIQVFRAF